jgi:hypothetical protein
MLHNLRVSIDRSKTVKYRPWVSRLSGAKVALLISVAALVAGFAVAASPLLLIVWEKPKSIDWNRLGEIGQAYDGTSAVLKPVEHAAQHFGVGAEGRAALVGQRH